MSNSIRYGVIPFFGLIGVAACIALGLYYFEPDRTAHPLRGIDVSHHQGRIDWKKVAQDDVSFAYIKATEGGDHRDTRFSDNWREAREAKIQTGAYHFFTFCRPGIDQAANFIGALEFQTTMLPAALDLEFGGNCSSVLTPSALRQEVDLFLEVVERHTRRPVVLYVTPEFWAAYKDILPPRPLWIRSLFRRPVRTDWTFWQYHNSSRVDGIVGKVDLNVFLQTPAALHDLARPRF